MLGLYLHTALLGKPQIVFGQRIRSTHMATHQAGAATGTASAVRAFATKIRVFDGLARLAEEHPDGGAGKAAFGSEVLGQFLGQLLGGCIERRGLHAQHAFGGVVVRL